MQHGSRVLEYFTTDFNRDTFVFKRYEDVPKVKLLCRMGEGLRVKELKKENGGDSLVASYSAGMGGGLGFFISSKLPGDAPAAGTQVSLKGVMS